MNFINTNLDDFQRLVCKDKIVCYGAGGTLLEFCDMFGKLNLQEKIIYIIDGDKKKAGSCFALAGRNIKVITLEFFLAQKMSNISILISCQDAYSVYQKLNAEARLHNTKCFYTEFIKYKTKEEEETSRIYPADFRVTMQQKIPKIIHYCWFGGKPIPEQNRKWMESWKEKCPDYQIMEWNETNYDINKNNFMKEAYAAKAWGFVPDYARLDIIYEYGGIYLDTDVEVIKNPDVLLYQIGFMGIDSSRDISLGLGFGAAPKNETIKLLLDDYEHVSFELDKKIAAPLFQRKRFNELGFIRNGDLQQINGITVYPEKVLSGKDNIVGFISLSPHTFFVHHYDGSWCNQSQIDRRKRMHQFYAEIVS